MLEGATTGSLPGTVMLIRQLHVFIAYVHEQCAWVGGESLASSSIQRGLPL
jgi:hypothetical protein